MKTKKEITKKTKAIKSKKTSTTRSISATKKVVKKTKTAPHRKTKTIAASKTGSALMRLARKEVRFNAKRITYMVLSLVVGFLSAGFVAGLLELVYLKNIYKLGIAPVTHNFLGLDLFLFPAFYLIIFGAGILLGTWLGFWGWRVVYIEHKHRMFHKK
jgi:hypothetical protein